MALDRRGKYELVQALLRAQNRKYDDNPLKIVAQTGAPSDERSSGEPPFGGPRFSLISQPSITAGNKAASQSSRFVPGPRPLSFLDPARFAHTDEGADMAKARGIPVPDQLAFKEAPSTSSWPASLETAYGRPLAAAAGTGLQQGYWETLWEGLFPSYCPPSDENLTFPPLIYQDKAPLTEADKDACHDQFEHDREQCYKNYSYHPDAWNGCYDRAKTIRDLCLRGEKETLPWNDVDQDGVRFPRPGRRRKRK